jgi:hypothetical protein
VPVGGALNPSAAATHIVLAKTLGAHKRLLAEAPTRWVGECVDVFGLFGHWNVARVIDIHPHLLVASVHFEGWGPDWDEAIVLTSQRIAKLGTRTATPVLMEQLNPGNRCEIATSIVTIAKCYAKLVAISNKLNLTTTTTTNATITPAANSTTTTGSTAATVTGTSDGSKMVVCGDSKVVDSKGGSARVKDVDGGLGEILSVEERAFVLRGENRYWLMRILNSTIDDPTLFQDCQHYLQSNLDIVGHVLWNCREVPAPIHDILCATLATMDKLTAYYLHYGREADARPKEGLPARWAQRLTITDPPPVEPPVSIFLIDNINHFGNIGGSATPLPLPSPCIVC